MANQPTAIFLNMVADRLLMIWGAGVHNEIIERLRSESARAKTLHANMAQNMDTYRLVQVTGVTARDGKHAFHLERRGRPGKIGTTLWMRHQEANDIARQLDAPVDYFND